MLLERYGLEVVMAFIKDMVRMWLHAWKRFISIALISLLGVAVLTGIYAGCRDAFLATDRFFDTQGLHDIQVLSTAGLTDDDIAELRKISGVAKVQGERSQTVTVDLNGKKTVTMQEIGTNGIDQPYLQSGRMPEKSGEIAVTRKFIKDSGYKKGDHITVTPQDSASSSVSDSAESDNQTRVLIPDVRFWRNGQKDVHFGTLNVRFSRIGQTRQPRRDGNDMTDGHT